MQGIINVSQGAPVNWIPKNQQFQAEQCSKQITKKPRNDAVPTHTASHSCESPCATGCS